MEISLTIKDDGDPPHQVLWPSGDIEESNAAVFAEYFAAVDTSMHLIIVLDDVPFLDSAGLGRSSAGCVSFEKATHGSSCP